MLPKTVTVGADFGDDHSVVLFEGMMMLVPQWTANRQEDLLWSLALSHDDGDSEETVAIQRIMFEALEFPSGFGEVSAAMDIIIEASWLVRVIDIRLITEVTADNFVGAGFAALDERDVAFVRLDSGMGED
jgi:hypothetical protein